MDIKYINILSKTSLFKNISIEDSKKIIPCLKPEIKYYKKNDSIINSGDIFKGFGLILEGNINVIKENFSGNRIIVASLDELDIFGEIMAFSKNKTWPSSVIALKDCIIVFINSKQILGYCDKACDIHKKIIINMLEIISSKALILNKKVEYLTMGSIREKISNFLIEEYKKTYIKTYTISMNRTELADYLYITRPSLSREMIKMKNEGIIDFYKSSIQILDIEKLKNQFMP
ncbi:MAG: Crp/Fnr family transcriptional regulator [Clostridiales bacterium]